MGRFLWMSCFKVWNKELPVTILFHSLNAFLCTCSDVFLIAAAKDGIFL